MRNKLIAYALDFTSFLIEKGIEPRKIILFGSVASGEFDKESDIDIFVDIAPEEKRTVENAAHFFQKQFGESWRLKGVTNPLSVTVGTLQKWADLRRSIQSYGILLYGKYSEVPENVRPYLLFRLNFRKISRAKKISLWRRLYGYIQKVGEKKYEEKGMVETLGGKKLEKSIVLIPSDKAKNFRDFLNEHSIEFRVNDIWSDSL